MASMRERWQAHVATIMRLICEQNDIPAVDMPEVPGDLYDGTGLTDRSRMVDVAYDLLVKSGKIGGEGGGDEQAE